MLKSHCNQVGQVPNFALYSGNLICACDFHTLQPAGMGGVSFHEKPCKQTCTHGTGIPAVNPGLQWALEGSSDTA